MNPSDSQEPLQQRFNFEMSPKVSSPPDSTDSWDEEDEDSEVEPESMMPECYTVSELTAYIEDVIDSDPVLGYSLVVQGEISNVKRSSRGHVYFTLKDESAAISGILWAGLAKNLSFKLEDGLEVYVTGNIELYAPNGTYSIVVKKMEPVGVGALQLAFQQIKQRLETEGLFMAEFKQLLPPFPQRIGIVTSRTGAVIHDMLRVIRRKNPCVDVLLAPVKVQGEGAAQEIAAAIQDLNDPAYALDLLIVARGGGSFEDLFCFSEEPVVRAVFNSTVPVITGIGHEPDFSLADAAADYSASTPTAAAEKAVPDYERLVLDLTAYKAAFQECITNALLWTEQQFDQKITALTDIYYRTLEGAVYDLASVTQRFETEVRQYFQTLDHQLAQKAAALESYSPLATLARGYSMAFTQDGAMIKSINQVKRGDKINVTVSDGKLLCEVCDYGE